MPLKQLSEAEISSWSRSQKDRWWFENLYRGDVPQLVRGALARQRRGAWSTTTANVWGVLALERFAAAFEREPVAGRSELRFRTVNGTGSS